MRASLSTRGKAIQDASFLLLVVLTTLAFFGLVRDLLMPVFWAAVLATVFHPVHRRYVARLHGRTALAAVGTVLTIVGLVVLPLFLVGLALSREAIELHQQIASGAVDVGAPLRVLRELAPIASDYLDRLGVDLERLVQQLSDAAVGVSQVIASRALALGQNVLRFIALFFVMLYVLFFFLRDGRRLVDALMQAVPLGDARERRLVTKFAEVSRATLKGTLVIGVVQGTLGGVLFWILGIPAPVLWGMVMTVLSILPAVGSFLVWGPAAIILLVRGEILKGIVLLAAGVLIIGLIDNLLRPILVGRDTQMPDYLVLLATLGGLAVFGISGFVIGPLIAAFFLVVWEMFAEEHAPRAPARARPTPEPPGGHALEPAASEAGARHRAPAGAGSQGSGTPEPRGPEPGDPGSGSALP